MTQDIEQEMFRTEIGKSTETSRLFKTKEKNALPNFQIGECFICKTIILITTQKKNFQPTDAWTHFTCSLVFTYALCSTSI